MSSTVKPGASIRGTWPLRDYPSVLWLVAALVVVLASRWVPNSRWLMVHLVLLGALSHAIMVWSLYFAQAVLKSASAATSRASQTKRITLLLAGSMLVLVGVPTLWWWLTVIGASLVAIAIGWHGWVLWRLLRRGLPGRFRVTLHYYLSAVVALVVGASLGAILALVSDDPWHGQLLLAHTMANLLGWVGLTVLGTLVTFWPTLLRTKMDPRADRLARQALPVLIVGLVLLVGGALLGMRWVAFAGLIGYLLGLCWWGRAILLPVRTKPPREFAAASVAAGLLWAVVGLVVLVVLLIEAGQWAAVSAGYSPIVAIFVVGLAAQVLTGALSYLMPTVLGGGPAVTKAALEWFNKFTTLRLVVINVGLALALLPVPHWVGVLMSILAVAGLASFVPLMVAGIRAAKRAKQTSQDAAASPASTQPGRPRIWSGGQLVAALTVLAVAVSVGVGIDPAAAGFTTTSSTPVVQSAQSSTGVERRVTVSAQDMVFVPNQITVNPGDRVIIELVNDDPTTVHDLTIAGRTTPRLMPGQSSELDLGTVTESLNGWCTVAGHRQMGMVFDVLVGDQAPGSVAPAEPLATQGHAPAPTGTALSRHVDPRLAPLGDERVHQLTLRVTEEVLEVAPGVWQKRWTYNGNSIGPTLHGRVGDVFEITLINDGTMGHSIDFHAGELAPDEPMRTIPPGESLLYRFTANRSGIWMYHCATAPMSSHIAAGMHGAVVIEPEGLPDVDRSYVLVQSEVYLTDIATDPAGATEVAADRIATEAPHYVVFNGIANQYDQFPFEARVGERVRFWVLDAGPNRASSFHIVGGQFDTLYFEGGYHLAAGQDGFGNTGGGAQALGLLPAQGGFVEIVFPEAGHYPVVSHIMSDAERGAHGVVRVTDG